MEFVGRVCALAVVAAAVLAGTAAQGQSVIPPEREASYERMAIGFKSSIRGGSIEPHWMADGHSFWYAEGPSTNPSILKVDPTSNRVTPLFDAAKLRAALATALGHELGPNFPFNTFAFLDGEKAIRFTVEGRTLSLDLDSYKITPTESPKDPPGVVQAESGKEIYGAREVPSPQGNWTAVVKDYNLWLRSSTDNRSWQLTTDGTIFPGAYLRSPGRPVACSSWSRRWIGEMSRSCL